MVLVTLAVLGVWLASRSISQTGDSTALFVHGSIRAEYVLTPERAERLVRPLGEDFDLTATENVVLSSGGKLVELETDEKGLVVGELASQAPNSFAFDNGTALLGISGQYFGQLEKTGAFSKGVPLPAPGMRLAPSSSPGGVYLFSGPGESNKRVYALSEDGNIGVIAELPLAIEAVTDSKNAVYLATASEIFRVTNHKVDLVVRLPETAGAIRSIAVSLDDRTLFFSTDERVYAMRGGSAIAIVKKAGGRIRFYKGTLYLWDPRRTLLLRLPNVESSL